MTTHITGCILTPDGWIRGTLGFGERITAIEGEKVPAPHDGESLVLPGFIDLHVHGGGGADVMDGNGAIDTVARTHARHGTTSLQPYTSQLDTQATDSSTLQMQNVGKQRVRISRVEFVDANGKSSMLRPGLLGYVLTGQTMKWQLPLPASLSQTGGRIDVRLNDDTQSQTLLQVPAGK